MTSAQEAKTKAGENDKTSPVSGISQFLGRVLEQLSLSSWMPAAMLVGNVALLLSLHSQKELDLGSAIEDLSDSPLGALVVLLLGLVLASALIQAFEFESIRLIEGYVNQVRGPLASLARRRIRAHASNREGLEKAVKKLEQAQFGQARTKMMQLPGAPFDQATLDALERDVFGRPQPGDLDPEWLEEALAVDWTEYLPAQDLYQLDVLDSRLALYPAAHRVLPTRLGNAMRAAEDTLTLGEDENLEGYVLRHHQDLPDLLKNEHHDYRTRLEMYAGLLLVFTILALVAAYALLAPAAPWQVALAVLAYLALAWLAYKACISSALGYGDVLREIDRFVRDQPSP